MDCSLLSSSVHGISQARILAWVAISFSKGSSWPRGWALVCCIGRQILYHWVTKEVPHAWDWQITDPPVVGHAAVLIINKTSSRVGTHTSIPPLCFRFQVNLPISLATAYLIRNALSTFKFYFKRCCIWQDTQMGTKTSGPTFEKDICLISTTLSPPRHYKSQRDE